MSYDDNDEMTQEIASRLQGKTPDFRTKFWERMRERQSPMTLEVARELEAEGIHAKDSGLEAAYQEELARIPNGAVRQIAKLKKKYRRRGLSKW